MIRSRGLASPVWVVILAGGIGSRFWPLSTPERPKQLLPLVGSRPLIAETLARVRGFADPDRVRVLCGADMVGPVRAVTGLRPEAFWIEPRAKGTGPVLARAAWEVRQQEPDAVLVSLHSDHLIRPAAALGEVLAAGMSIAARERLLLAVSVPPDRPETGYGYIRPGSPLQAPNGHRAYQVESFVEKPDSEAAARYISSGYRWNSGIFILPVSVFLEEVAAHAPGIARALPRLKNDSVTGFFEDTESISVDEGIMERSGRVGAIEATFQWDDVGSWQALSRTKPADQNGNIRVGDVCVSGASGNIAVAAEGRLVLLGVRDLVAVRTGDITLVMPKERAPYLKEYLKSMTSDRTE